MLLSNVRRYIYADTRRSIYLQRILRLAREIEREKTSINETSVPKFLIRTNASRDDVRWNF